MPPGSPIDISSASFEQFVDFLFKREVPTEDQSFAALYARSETERWRPWYYETEVIFDIRKTSQHYSRLFLEPKFLLERFSQSSA